MVYPKQSSIPVSTPLSLLILQIEEAWQGHVSLLSRQKSFKVAVHTHFLFPHLYAVLRQQLSSLTREACNYLANGYHNMAAHFLVTVELLYSQFQLPKVYLDSELVRAGNWRVCMRACV